MPIDMNELHLPEAAFWESGSRSMDPVVRRHGTSHFGVVVDAPREVDLAARRTLPLFLYYMGTFRQTMTRDLEGQGVVTIMDTDRNLLYLTQASAQDAGEDLEPSDFAAEPVEEDEIPNGYISTAQVIELRERLDLPWRPTELSMQAILLDLVSPRISSRLASGASQFQDPEVARFLAEERSAQNPPGPYPTPRDDRHVSWKKAAASPELPDDFGVALHVDRVVAVESNKPVLLHGAWRLPLFPEDLVKPSHESYNQDHGLLAPNGRPYAAVVRIFLLVIGSGENNPRVFPLALPVAETDGESASGYFTIDLRSLPAFPISEQTLFFHAYSRSFAAEPVVMGMLDRREFL